MLLRDRNKKWVTTINVLVEIQSKAFGFLSWSNNETVAIPYYHSWLVPWALREVEEVLPYPTVNIIPVSTEEEIHTPTSYCSGMVWVLYHSKITNPIHHQSAAAPTVQRRDELGRCKPAYCIVISGVDINFHIISWSRTQYIIKTSAPETTRQLQTRSLQQAFSSAPYFLQK